MKAEDELESLRHAHSAYYLALAEEALPTLYGSKANQWMERLEQEQANLRATLHHALERADQGKQMATKWRCGS